MRNLFEPTDADAIKDRIAHLRPDSPRQWGSMTATQTLAHCSVSIAMATGDLRPPRAFMGRLMGRLIKRFAVGNDEPMRRNSPTIKELKVPEGSDFSTEQARLADHIDRLVAAGPSSCTTHPHPFFGPLTPAEWGNLMFKHLDHHLRQFGV